MYIVWLATDGMYFHTLMQLNDYLTFNGVYKKCFSKLFETALSICVIQTYLNTVNSVFNNKILLLRYDHGSLMYEEI